MGDIGWNPLPPEGLGLSGSASPICNGRDSRVALPPVIWITIFSAETPSPHVLYQNCYPAFSTVSTAGGFDIIRPNARSRVPKGHKKALGGTSFPVPPGAAFSAFDQANKPSSV